MDPLDLLFGFNAAHPYIIGPVIVFFFRLAMALVGQPTGEFFREQGTRLGYDLSLIGFSMLIAATFNSKSFLSTKSASPQGGSVTVSAVMIGVILCLVCFYFHRVARNGLLHTIPEGSWVYRLSFSLRGLLGLVLSWALGSVTLWIGIRLS